jgi:glucoamylase
VFDLPPQTVQRYLVEKAESPRIIWRFAEKIRIMPAGLLLRIETHAPAFVHWSSDGWDNVADLPTTDSGLGVHFADLPTSALPVGKTIRFTFHWPENDHWEGTDFLVVIEAAPPKETT